MRTRLRRRALIPSPRLPSRHSAGTQNAQDVPIQLQALTAETLTQLNVATFDEFRQVSPQCNDLEQRPSQGDIYMRGLAALRRRRQVTATGKLPQRRGVSG